MTPISGNIISSIKVNAIGVREAEEFSLQGGPWFEIDLRLARQIGYAGADDHGVITIGPYQFLIVEELWERRSVRCLINHGWRSRLTAWWYRQTPAFRILKSRIILTFAVWGLAAYNEMAVPEWTDIYFVHRLRGLR